MAGLHMKNETGGTDGSSDVAGSASQGNHGSSAEQSKIVSFFKKQMTNDSPSEKRQTTIKKFFLKQKGGNMPTKQTRFVQIKKTVLKLGSADATQQNIKKTTVGGDGTSKQTDPSMTKPNKMEPKDVQKNCGPPRECFSALWSGGVPMMMDGGFNRKMTRIDPEGFGLGCESPSPRPALRRSERLGSGSFGLSPTTTEEFPGDDSETSPCQASPAASSTNRQPSSTVESLPASNAKSQ